MVAESWKRELQLAEIDALRGEINATLSLMNANENYCSGASAALLAFGVSQTGLAGRGAIFLIAAMIPAFGLFRFLLLRRHTHILDDYTAELELELSPTGGWVTRYRQRPQRLGGFFATQIAFWIVLVVFPIVAFVFDIRFT